MNVSLFVPGMWTVLTPLSVRQSLSAGSTFTPRPTHNKAVKSMMPTGKGSKPRKAAKPCDICHEFFYYHTGVRIHKARENGFEHLFDCTIENCEKKFATKRDLSVHIVSCQRKVYFIWNDNRKQLLFAKKVIRKYIKDFLNYLQAHSYLNALNELSDTHFYSKRI